ncbi:unnamed protein product [Aureobasidium pullulans]|nr:unnamed protein product [Aureobasidium pullulans]
MDPSSNTNTPADDLKNFPNTIMEGVEGILAANTASGAATTVQNQVRPKPSCQYTTHDSPEDSSSGLSSVESEPLSSVPDAQGASLSKVDVNGILRYGSLDADETGLSSVTSGPSTNKRPFQELHSYPESQVSDDDRAAKRPAFSSQFAPLPDHATPSSRSSLLSNIHVEARPDPSGQEILESLQTDD